jgi:hypothetical protein
VRSGELCRECPTASLGEDRIAAEVIARLTLEWRARRDVGDQFWDGSRFLDFIVDGESLYERHDEDLISCLGWLPAEMDEAAAARLLGVDPPDMGDQVGIYICPADADPLCGGISARIVRVGDDVKWENFAISYPDWGVGTEEWDHCPLVRWPELIFDATQYDAVILDRQSRT